MTTNANPEAMPPVSGRAARWRLLALAIAMAFVSAAAQAQAQTKTQSAPDIFRGADFKLGESLIREHQCVQCHQRKVGGDGSTIYRPMGRISTPGYLRGMVEQCNTELNLGLFPEEVTAVAAVLNRDHYRFK